MKKYYSILLLLLASHWLLAQENPVAEHSKGLGHGLNFNLNEGDYQFKISGYLQPSIQYSRLDNAKGQAILESKRTYLNFSGKALKEKVSFFLQSDFSAGTPLLDAYATYHFTGNWSVSAGQKRTFTNSRELTFDEDKLQFTERGSTSTYFSGNGREFGLFLEGSVGNSFLVKPQLAITSGDGPNSFGANAMDIDLGGLKYGGRLDFYPMGEFQEGNRGFSADLRHEQKLKLLIGLAGSINQGASNAKGEGHGDFVFYDINKKSKLPDLRKVSADVMLKYRGFSVLAEFLNTSANSLSGIYADTTGKLGSLLKPGQISQFLVLGNAFNIQAGYVTKTGYGLDVRLENLNPEFSYTALSQLQQTKIYTLGLSRYFADNRLKLQGLLSSVRYQTGIKTFRSELMLQVVF
jgi:Phosphate-selective porin O and P